MQLHKQYYSKKIQGPDFKKKLLGYLGLLKFELF